MGPVIEGLSSPERPTSYSFDVSDLPNGDYSADISNPAAAFVFRIAGGVVTYAAIFEDLDRTRSALSKTLESSFLRQYRKTCKLIFSLRQN